MHDALDTTFLVKVTSASDSSGQKDVGNPKQQLLTGQFARRTAANHCLSESSDQQSIKANVVPLLDLIYGAVLFAESNLSRWTESQERQFRQWLRT
jgi:hypothetical protein